MAVAELLRLDLKELESSYQNSIKSAQIGGTVNNILTVHSPSLCSTFYYGFVFYGIEQVSKILLLGEF